MTRQITKKCSRSRPIYSPHIIEIAEAEWIGSLLTELTEGSLPGLDDWRRWHDTGGTPPGWDRLMEEMGEEKRS